MLARIRGIRRISVSFAGGVLVTLLLVALPAWALTCNSCVNTGDIVNGQISRADLANNSVGPGELVARAVRAPDIGPLPAVRVTHSDGQSALNATQGSLTFDTEAFDIGGMHAPGSPTRLTAPRAGIYEIGYAVLIDNADTDGYRQITIVRDDTVTVHLERIEGEVGPLFHTAISSTLLPVSQGDYFELDVFQNSGTDLDVYGDGGAPPDIYAPVFWMRWVSPLP